MFQNRTFPDFEHSLYSYLHVGLFEQRHPKLIFIAAVRAEKFSVRSEGQVIINDHFAGHAVQSQLDHVLAARVVHGLTRLVLGEDEGGDQPLAESLLILK